MVHLNTLPVNLPAASSPPREDKPTVISVTVNQKGNVFTTWIQSHRWRSENKHRSRCKINRMRSLSYGDRETSYQDITRVLDALKSAGAKHVSLAADVKK